MSRYVFDAEWEKERERLAGLEGWLDPGTVRHLETVGVGPGWRCLEVGGGGGSIARWLCARVGSGGRVVATDLDTRFLAPMSEPNLEVLRHDIVSDDLPASSFDLAHARLVLEHIPAREEVLERLTAALKPGGWLLVEDMDFITHVPVTPSDTYERVGEAVTSVMITAGFDPFFGRRLPLLLNGAGLEDVEAEGRVVIGKREGNPGLDMYRLTLERLRPVAIPAGLATDRDFDQVLGFLDDPSFLAMPPTVVAAWGRKPG